MVLDKTQRKQILELFVNQYEKIIELDNNNIGGVWYKEDGNLLNKDGISSKNTFTKKMFEWRPNDEDLTKGISENKRYQYKAINNEAIIDSINIFVNGKNILCDDFSFERDKNIISITTKFGNPITYTSNNKNMFSCVVDEYSWGFGYWFDDIFLSKLDEAFIKFLSIYVISNE